MGKLYDFIFGKPRKDQLMEVGAKKEGVFPDEPGWFVFLRRKLVAIIFVIALIIAVVLRFLYHDTVFTSQEGVQGIILLIVQPIVAPLFLLIFASVTLWRKYRYRNKLTGEDRVAYDQSVWAHVMDIAMIVVLVLVVLFAVALISYPFLDI